MRRLLPFIACACLLGAALAPVAAAGPAARPNIVFVLTDDQRWDTLDTMPIVTRELVHHGVTFTNAFAVNPLCCPSRSSILTGRYSHSTGVYSNTVPYGGASWFDDDSTIATWLHNGGYRTGYIGKYMNGYNRTWVPPGWDRWIGFDGGFFNYGLNIDGTNVFYGGGETDYSTDVLTNEAVSFISTAPTTQPFFLVYAPFAPHTPATPAPRDADAFPALHDWRPPSYDEDDVSDKPRWLRKRPHLTDADILRMDELRRSELQSLQAVDDGVSRILTTLNDLGYLEHTIVVYMSDNGLLWGEHRQIDRKVSAFEESIRLPLVIRYDAALGRRPRTEDRMVTNLDLAPTFAALGGVKAPAVEGRSLLPLLGTNPPGPTQPWRSTFTLEHLRGAGGAAAEVTSYCGTRGKRWKYVVYSTHEEELYDLAADRYELQNRAADPAIRPVLMSMRRQTKAGCQPPPPGMGLDWLCTVEANRTSRLSGTQGKDTICGGPIGERISAGAGDDVVRADGGGDVIDGARGDDQLTGGAGRDVILGGPGSDIVFSRDNVHDRLDCGRGYDIAVVDRGDAVKGCEAVRRSGKPRP
jgi:arylsulfatase A-like enzyme